jgi:hypothetical protein
MNRSNVRTLVNLAMAALAVGFAARQTAYGQCHAPQSKKSAVVETANFRIYGIGGLRDAARIGDDFESLRERLCRTWLGEKRLPDWSPKCDVVVHSTARSYLRAVGQDRFATVGASLIDINKGCVSRRRIDIRADQAGWLAAAAPHELTHIIMADEFLGSNLPNWADEGMAILADSAAKQSLHRRDLNDGYCGRAVFRLVEFMCQACYPSADRIPVFYGQSVSLVKFLVERKSPAEFVRFMHRSEKVGCDAALAEVYGLGGVAELERQWLQTVAGPTHPTDKLAMATAAEANAAASRVGS